jgi:hypothetical protein
VQQSAACHQDTSKPAHRDGQYLVKRRDDLYGKYAFFAEEEDD